MICTPPAAVQISSTGQICVGGEFEIFASDVSNFGGCGGGAREFEDANLNEQDRWDQVRKLVPSRERLERFAALKPIPATWLNEELRP